MTSRDRRSDALRALCAQVHDEDGVRPERKRSAPKREAWRDERLCAQVRRALNGALGGECGSRGLRGVVVDSVEPAPDATRVRAVVRVPGEVDRPAREALLAELRRASVFLRLHVAAALSRKRVPEIVFAVRGEEVIDEG